jgi:hypothetical protein
MTVWSGLFLQMASMFGRRINTNRIVMDGTQEMNLHHGVWEKG